MESDQQLHHWVEVSCPTEETFTLAVVNPKTRLLAK